jgi:hypothetical protein
MRTLQAMRERTEDLPEPEAAWHLVRDALLPGAMVGTLGALVMALLAGGVVGVLHGDPWRPALLVAGTFFRGGEASGVWAVVLGLFLHFSVAGGMATGFAVLLPRSGTAVAALCLGMLYSLGLWGVMTELILPFGSPPLYRASPGPLLLLLHLAFGAALATLPAARLVITRLDRARRLLRGAAAR